MTVASHGYLQGQRHLARRDPVLRGLIRTIGPCTLQPNPDRFGLLVRSIISQQISSKAAVAISTRLEQALRPGGFTPRRILGATEATLRAAGLSMNKQLSLRDLAERVHSRAVPLRDMHDLADEEVIERLLPVRGIGRWTAQMFLIFSLGRLDVLPVDDLGLRVGVQRQYGLKEPPGKAELEELAKPGQPDRSIATWDFCRGLGAVP